MGLMKRIATEVQMGNSAPMSEREAQERLGFDSMGDLPPRPASCTRRRLKPGIDGCGCVFCEAIDGPYMNAEPPEESVAESEGGAEWNGILNGWGGKQRNIV